MKIVSGSGTDSSAIRGFVDRAVHQGVGEPVQLARDVLDRSLREARQELARAERERSQAGVLDLPESLHLLHDEHRIHADIEHIDATPKGLLQSDDQSRVLGHVVRGMAEGSHELGDDLAVLVQEHRAGARGPGIAAGAAVGVERRAAHARKPASRSASTLPPDTMATTRSPVFGRTAPARRAPTAAAPAGSATTRARETRKRSPSRMASSGIATTSSTSRRMISRFRLPANGAARPSATVFSASRRTGRPAARPRRTAWAPSGSTPTIRAPGLSALTASATPEMSPPPPTGTTTRSTRSRSSMISCPRLA